jgi:hypothetical protein
MSRNYEIRSIGFARDSKKVFRFNCVCIGGGVASEWLVDDVRWRVRIRLRGLSLSAS